MARTSLRRCYRGAVVAIILVATIFSLSPPKAEAQVGGVTVINVAPEFSSLEVRSVNGHQHIDLVISDYNSWEDIYRVDLEVLDASEVQIAHVAFQQYDDNATQSGESRFVEFLGQILVRDLSLFAYSTDPISIEDRTEMRITFVITPIMGRWLKVVAMDLAGYTAYAQIEFPDGRIGDNGEAMPSLVLIMLAVVAAVIIVSIRVRREVFGR